MIQEISVDQAISRGHLIVNLPVFICIIGIPAGAFYLSNQNLIPKWSIAIGFVLGIAIAWLVWSFMITKWRIWAFSNVRNVHELKKRAIQEKLIWHDGNVFERTEIRNLDEVAQLKKLDKKFEKEDVYKEDFSIPPKSIIKFSKSLLIFELLIATVIIGIGLYLISKGSNKSYFLGGIMSCIGIYSFTKGLPNLLNQKPQISIDNKGIETVKTGFKSWSTIRNEEVIREGSGKSTHYFLQYKYDKGRSEKVEIDALNITHQQLENLLRTYRIRYRKITGT